MEQEYKSKIKYLTINEIIDKYGDCLSMKEINYLFNLVLDSKKFNEPFMTFYQVFCIRIKRDLKIKKLPISTGEQWSLDTDGERRYYSENMTSSSRYYMIGADDFKGVSSESGGVRIYSESTLQDEFGDKENKIEFKNLFNNIKSVFK